MPLPFQRVSSAAISLALGEARVGQGRVVAEGKPFELQSLRLDLLRAMGMGHVFGPLVLHSLLLLSEIFCEKLSNIHATEDFSSFEDQRKLCECDGRTPGSRGRQAQEDPRTVFR